ncbi:MAG: hypothetical protein GQ507_00470, partial [Dehalococcoidales bacterium]|nr:hypothetical protein [Dehalococcoidales bacterium]
MSLEVDVSPLGSGSIEVDGDAPCSLNSYPDTIGIEAGDNVLLEAIPEPGYHFVNWSGEPVWDGESTSSENPTEVRVINAMDITAYFAADSNEFISEDEIISITIPDGATALDGEGNPLTNVEFVAIESAPDPSEDASIIGLPYQLGPDGATFDPPVTLTWNYDPTDIPDGVAEEDLVIAYYDEDAARWQELESTVNPETNTITAPVGHFTTFTVIAPLSTAPAAFTIGSLSISPPEVSAGEPVAISLVVANTGEVAGSYTATLKINGAIAETVAVTVAGGGSETVTFTTSHDETGIHSI